MNELIGFLTFDSANRHVELPRWMDERVADWVEREGWWRSKDLVVVVVVW